MLAMEVVLDSEKKFNLSIEEFVALLNVNDTYGLGCTKSQFIGNLEMSLDNEEGTNEEFTLREKAAIQILIPKISTLTDEQVKKINVAIEKAGELFNIFNFFNPLDRVYVLEPFKNAVMQHLNN